MKKRRSIVKHLCLLAVCLLTSAFARAARNPVPVYLVVGQSNTDGRVPNSELPAYIQQAPYEHCYWSYGSGTHGGNGQFELFRPRIFNKNMPGRWAYDAVTYFWLEKSLHRDFYVIKESLGGTAIDLRAKSTNNMYWSASTAFLDTTSPTARDVPSCSVPVADIIIWPERRKVQTGCPSFTAWASRWLWCAIGFPRAIETGRWET